MAMSEIELYELFNALVNGTISSDQHARLDEFLASEPAARELYYDYLDVHLRLHRQFSSHDPLAPSMELPPEPSQSSTPKLLAKKRRSSTWTHLAAIAATILSVLGVQQFNRVDNSESPSVSIAEESTASSNSTYIATLLKSADCVWDGEHRPKFDGQRLLTNELQLKKGIAEFRFDVGVRLVMEGPAFLTIESATSALLSTGKVVLHGSDMGSPFELNTPATTLLDIGTEYGASVNSQGVTEVHVFEGEVSAVPRGDTAEVTPRQLFEGQASSFDSSGSRSVEFASMDFIRQIPESSLPTLRRKGVLLAYEGFNYQTPTLSSGNGGIGWSGKWRDWQGLPGHPSKVDLQQEGSFAHGPHLRLVGKENVAWRTLQSPIRLDQDGVYFLSFLVKKINELERGKTQFGSVSLRSAGFPKDDFKLSFGMSSENNAALTHNKQQLTSAPPIPVDQAVFIVAKIAAGKDTPDQVMLRWYGPSERVDSTEPHSWSIISSPEYSDAVFEKLSISSGGDVEFHFDEVRIGTSWSRIIEGFKSDLQ